MLRFLPIALFLLTGTTAGLAADLAPGADMAGTMTEPVPTLTIELDHARVVQIDEPATTVIVGNPAIVDVEVLSSRRLVLTGRSYGITNLIVLDQSGDAIVDQQIAVQTFEDQTVRVYRQASRTTLACAPKCEPTVTIGDNEASFSAAAGQYSTHQQLATSAAAQ